MQSKHQWSRRGTEDEDGLILNAAGIVAGTKGLVLSGKAPGEVRGHWFWWSGLRKAHWSQFQKAAPEST